MTPFSMPPYSRCHFSRVAGHQNGTIVARRLTGLTRETAGALRHRRGLRGLSRHLAVTTTVGCRAHAGASWSVRRIHLALTADQSVGTGILDAGGASATNTCTGRRAAVIIRPTVAGAAGVTELTR